ncbi:MAG: hypothetical protein E7456_07155 [Ruminococcaceae bacterium]|nr:hypothetical protein [Oscillospiraceae bacterium]
MRNLTIKRHKAFTASLAKSKVYIEDHNSHDLIINGIPCRKLGALKNNDEQTFEIGSEAAKVFIIGDKLSKNYCNEFFDLPEGDEDIFLSGRHKFNLANGNAFVFDNNDSPEVLAYRKKNKRKGLVILLAALVIGGAAGYLLGSLFASSGSTDAKTFSSNGMTITLTEEFTETSMEGFTVCYDSANAAVIALKEDFTLMDGFGDLTIEEYGSLVMQGSGLEASDLDTDGDLRYFAYTYEDPSAGDNYLYVIYVYKTSDAFWLVEFVTPEVMADEYVPLIMEWAESVEFK